MSWIGAQLLSGGSASYLRALEAELKKALHLRTKDDCRLILENPGGERSQMMPPPSLHHGPQLWRFPSDRAHSSGFDTRRVRKQAACALEWLRRSAV